eukprot:TRINITY_DN48208_c0_g1_i1.p1 TRINITY_DN48208_c0_g1~~TRINITY_DN48208_c0_g1_i1.p1  ORF type:complete len:488 (+),score=97.86 TRINITY_DN48208_c0_g1_i1:208-1464(+)
MNEKWFVCTDTALRAAKESFVELSCTATSANTGDFIHMQGCQLGNPRKAFSPAEDYGMGGMVANGKNVPEYVGYQSKMKAEMYQCKENYKTVKEGKQERKEYYYTMEWSQSYFGQLDNPADVGKKSQVCGEGPNPTPPAELQGNMGNSFEDHLRIASDATLGVNYYLDEDLIRQIPIDKNVNMAAFSAAFTATTNTYGPSQLVPSIFAPKQDGTTSWITNCPQGWNVKGCIRLAFWTTSATTASVLGGIESSKVTKWDAPTTWLCDSEGVMLLQVGSATMETMMSFLNDQNGARLVMLRVVFWLLSCLGVYMFLYPLFAFFDILTDYIECIPCIGDFIADSVDTIVGCALCCFAFLVGSFFSLLTIAFSWLFVRPIIGVPLLIAALALGGGIIYWRSTLPKGSRGREVELSEQDSEDA